MWNIIIIIEFFFRRNNIFIIISLPVWKNKTLPSCSWNTVGNGTFFYEIDLLLIGNIPIIIIIRIFLSEFQGSVLQVFQYLSSTPVLFQVVSKTYEYIIAVFKNTFFWYLLLHIILNFSNHRIHLVPIRFFEIAKSQNNFYYYGLYIYYHYIHFRLGTKNLKQHRVRCAIIIIVITITLLNLSHTII